MAGLQHKDFIGQADLFCQTVIVSCRSSVYNRKTGHLHMKTIQWHLKNHLYVQSHLALWLDINLLLYGQPLHLLQHPLQLFTDASNKDGAHRGLLRKSLWSKPDYKLNMNFLELKTIPLVLKKFVQLYLDQTILITTDNTTVVSYINT